jgi:uncharacterized membrane-anchored protein
MTKSRTVVIAMVSCLVLSGQARAQEPQGGQITAEEFEAKLGYQTGTVSLPGGMATIKLPPSFRFISAEGSRRLLTEAWGNPPGAAEGVLGMLIPTSLSPLTKEGWGVVITYDQDGYVNDDDAVKIDYGKMLKELQENTVEANAERQKQGFEPVTLVGWAEPPTYDRAAHKLYWAKELAFGNNGEHTLNYSIRILGRRGVLILNAVASMNQLEAIRSESRRILPAVEFSDGHRYTDYIPGTDKAAAYGVAGLIVGATAAKAGLFKVLLAGLLAFKKVLVVGVVGAGAAIKRFLTGRTGEAPEQQA